MHTAPQPVGQAGTPSTYQSAPQDDMRVAEQFVGQDRALMSDEELEDHIQACTLLMELAYERYERDGFMADRGDADRWMRLRDEAIRSRSPAQVARLERERGLA